MKQPKKKTRKSASRSTLSMRRDKALERVITLWEKDQDVNHALDVLTLAHAAATFEFVGG